MDEPVREWYEPDGDPREALGRLARRLKGGGALYLGGGVGVEQTSKVQGTPALRVESYTVTPGGSTHDGPLSAVTAALIEAGKSKAADTPGGASTVTDPAAAARLFELDASEREEKGVIARYEARLAARARSANAVVGVTRGLAYGDEGWEQRRIEEARSNLVAIAVERRKLLSGKLSEAEAGKPGTNWKQVTPANRKRVGPLVNHYRKQAHPFTACVADNTKRFGPERAKRVCAVVKDMGERSTKWRKGGKKLSEMTDAEVGQLVAESAQRVSVIDSVLGDGAAVQAALLAPGVDDDLAELCFADLSLLFLAGHEWGEAMMQAAEAPRHARQHRHRDGQWANVLARAGSSDGSPLRGPDGELRVNTPHPEPEPAPVAESLMDSLLAGARRG